MQLRDIEIANNSYAIKRKVIRRLEDLGYEGFMVQEVFYERDHIKLKLNNDKPGAQDVLSDAMCSQLTTHLGQLVTPGGQTLKYLILCVWNSKV